MKAISPKSRSLLELKKIFRLRSLLIAALLYFGFIVASHYIFLKPQFNRYAVLEQEKERLNRIYYNIHPVVLDSTLNKLTYKTSEAERIKQNFITRTLDIKNLPSLLTELNYMAKDQEIDFDNITPLQEAKKIDGNYQKRFIQINFKASYTQFLTLLQSLENAKYWLLIDSFSIRQNSQDPLHHNISLKLFTITHKT